MAIIVPTKFFLTSILSKREKATLKQIKEYTRRIYDYSGDRPLFVDSHSKSLYGICESSPDLFYIREEAIFRRNNKRYFGDREFILNCLGHSLDRDIREKVFLLLSA